MQELIIIQNTQIGTEVIQSINARDLYVHLEIKQKFSNWIQKQLERVGLKEGKHYLTSNIKVNRQTLKEYQLTIDSAKHIAMMSQSKKAHEIRDYFIEVEKQYKQIQPNQNITNLTTAVLEQTKMLSVVFEKFNGMEKEMIETRAVMQTIKRDMSVLPKMSDTNDELKKYLKKQPIDPDKIRIIRNAVTDRALELAKRHNIDSGICQRHIYTRIREVYKLSMYVELPSVHFEGCLKMIDKTTMNTYMTQPFEDIDDIALAEEIL